MKVLAFFIVLFSLNAASAAQAALERWRDPKTGLEFVKLEAGCFDMGNPSAVEPETESQFVDMGFFGGRHADEAPVHEVCLSPYWIATTELTAQQWRQVMGTLPPAGRGNQPAGNISWEDAQRLLNRLNKDADAPQFRLPTEAEWELACRGTMPVMNNLPHEIKLNPYAWFSSDAKRRGMPQAVAQNQPYAHELHDMLGNVWEWVADNYDAEAYAQHPRHNPVTEAAGSTKRVIRGGSYRSGRSHVRCASRGWHPQHSSMDSIGVRLVREAP